MAIESSAENLRATTAIEEQEEADGESVRENASILHAPINIESVFLGKKIRTFAFAKVLNEA